MSSALTFIVLLRFGCSGKRARSNGLLVRAVSAGGTCARSRCASRRDDHHRTEAWRRCAVDPDRFWAKGRALTARRLPRSDPWRALATVGLPAALLASLASLDEIAANRYPAIDWKADLRMSRHEFTDYERLAQGTASVCIAVERYLMHSALAMRKLLVQQVLTDEVVDAKRPVLSYPCIRR